MLTPCRSRLRRQSLKYVIVRPAVVYGPHDISGISTWPACTWLRGYEHSQKSCALVHAAPRLVIGAIYQHTGEEMKFLWNKDMRINTVHVR